MRYSTYSAHRAPYKICSSGIPLSIFLLGVTPSVPLSSNLCRLYERTKICCGNPDLIRFLNVGLHMATPGKQPK